MLTLTEDAGAHLARLQQAVAPPEDQAARFVFEEEGLVLAFERRQPDDVTLHHGGRPVLALDPELGESLRDQVLDVVASRHGPVLVVMSRN
jgi:hypothetical protein